MRLNLFRENKKTVKCKSNLHSEGKFSECPRKGQLIKVDKLKLNNTTQFMYVCINISLY